MNPDNSQEDIKDKEQIFSYNLTEGNFLLRKRRFKEAVQSYSRALQITPNHETCLTMRSKCYLLLGEHDKALKDSEDALANNPTSNTGIIQKAEALYAQGEFEYALVCFHRGKKLRKDIEDFELGVQKSSEAIENSIGEKSGLRFCRVGRILKQLQDKQDTEEQATTLRGQKRKQTPTEYHDAQKNYGCKILLEELSQDKAFLQRLIQHPELSGTCKDDIVKEATEVLEFMQTRQEFWGQQKPLYARKIQRKMAEGKTTLDEEDEQLRKRIEDKKSKTQSNHELITKLLVNIDSALQHGSYEQALTMCASAEETIMSYNVTWLPRRQAYLGVVYSALGDAHLKLGHYRQSLHWHNKDYDLSKDNPRLLHSRARALDNLGHTHATFRKYQDAINAWEQRIPLCKSPEKRTWLFHEIGTCYKQLGRYETARFYGTKCVKEARRCEQHQWLMRGVWLLADSETQLEAMDAALKHYDQALEIAGKHGSKREAADIERARVAAVALMKERQQEKLQTKAMYGTVGVVTQGRPPPTGNVTFEEPDDQVEQQQPGEEANVGKPSVAVSASGGDDSCSLETTDSFDDSGSYIDWTDEDTLPPEFSQEQLDGVKAKQDGEEEGSGGDGESDGDTVADSDSDMSSQDAEKTDTEESEVTEASEAAEGTAASETAGETEFETAANESTAAEETEGEMATADEGEALNSDDAVDKAQVGESDEKAGKEDVDEGAPAVAEGQKDTEGAEGNDGAVEAVEGEDEEEGTTEITEGDEETAKVASGEAVEETEGDTGPLEPVEGEDGEAGAVEGEAANATEGDEGPAEEDNGGESAADDTGEDVTGEVEGEEPANATEGDEGPAEEDNGREPAADGTGEDVTGEDVTGEDQEGTPAEVGADEQGETAGEVAEEPAAAE